MECWVVDVADELEAGSLWIPKVGNWTGEPKDLNLEACQLGRPTVEAEGLVVGTEDLDHCELALQMTGNCGVIIGQLRQWQNHWMRLQDM